MGFRLAGLSLCATLLAVASSLLGYGSRSGDRIGGHLAGEKEWATRDLTSYLHAFDESEARRIILRGEGPHVVGLGSIKIP